MGIYLFIKKLPMLICKWKFCRGLEQSPSNQLQSPDIYYKVKLRTFTKIKGLKPKHDQDPWGLEVETGRRPRD